MRTPLFPPDDKTHIRIQQGPHGSCYLLAFLDCMFNDPQGRDKIKSLFKEREDGIIEVRIKRNPQSVRLDKEEIRKGGYEYHWDKDTGEDVFILSKQKANKIDTPAAMAKVLHLDDPVGVQSNSLAVKILEHLCPYYFGNWMHEDMHSLEAHAARKVEVGTTQFLGQLFGISTTAFTTPEDSDFTLIQRLKTIAPHYPIYLSMNYNRDDQHGMEHNRHAFRIKKITQNAKGEVNFTLVNPWDNQTEEIFSLKDIQAAHPSVSLFNVNPAVAPLIPFLVQEEIAAEDGKYILETPALITWMSKLERLKQDVSPLDIQSSVTLYKQLPEIAELFARLNTDEALELQRIINDARGDKKQLLTLRYPLILNNP